MGYLRHIFSTYSNDISTLIHPAGIHAVVSILSYGSCNSDVVGIGLKLSNFQGKCISGCIGVQIVSGRHFGVSLARITVKYKDYL